MSATVPFSNAAAFFRDAGEPAVEPIFPPPDISPENRTTCRWCLRPFDSSQVVRTTAEYGYLIPHLMMADNGSLPVICTDCWQGAIGAKHLMHGQLIPADPNVIGNPILRMIAE